MPLFGKKKSGSVSSGKGYPAQSSYPTQQQASQQAPYPSQQPAYPGQQPAYPGQQPAYPGQQPAFSGQQQPYPPQHQAYPGQYGMPVQPPPSNYPTQPGPSTVAYPPQGAPPPYTATPYRPPPQQAPAIGVFDQGARFDSKTGPSIPPPPPGYAPNAAQIAVSQGQNVTMTQQKRDVLFGSDGGYTLY